MSHDRVTERLHTLRGEHFRRTQNQRKSRTHLAANVQRSVHTLPIIDLDDEHPPNTAPYKNTPGPEAPKSWTLTKPAEDDPAWRARALSLLLPALPSIPTLSNICLRILIALPAPEFIRDVVPWLDSHLRRDLIRQAAVQSPLPDAKLWPLCRPDGHADTELIVVGTHATLPENYFMRSPSDIDKPDLDGTNDWDIEKPDVEPLNTLVLMSMRLAASTFLSLPPTITHMALLNISSQIPIHRLPRTCPMLVILDLSYNSWLSTQEASGRIFERVEWGRWNDLRVLGLRECAVSSVVLEEINKRRWDDVQIVQ
ncbi:hypothetical protein H0H92_000014 [Tricholoma furcatifolium]|nr:hypothetical protein H0H92_000014 [Tricholoma furcatifolium]